MRRKKDTIPMDFNITLFIVVDESTVTWHCCCHALAKTHNVVCAQLHQCI